VSNRKSYLYKDRALAGMTAYNIEGEELPVYLTLIISFLNNETLLFDLSCIISSM
jgi:hypothetical protein